VRLVVLGEDVSPLVLALEPAAYLARKVQLFVEPEGHGGEKRPEPRGGEREVGLQQALELQKRLVVEPDVIELLRREPALFETVVDRVDRKAVVVLLPREPLLLGRGGDVAVDDQHGGRVVIERRDAENCRHGNVGGPRLRLAEMPAPKTRSPDEDRPQLLLSHSRAGMSTRSQAGVRSAHCPPCAARGERRVCRLAKRAVPWLNWYRVKFRFPGSS